MRNVPSAYRRCMGSELDYAHVALDYVCACDRSDVNEWDRARYGGEFRRGHTTCSGVCERFDAEQGEVCERSRMVDRTEEMGMKLDDI